MASCSSASVCLSASIGLLALLSASCSGTLPGGAELNEDTLGAWGTADAVLPTEDIGVPLPSAPPMDTPDAAPASPEPDIPDPQRPDDVLEEGPDPRDGASLVEDVSALDDSGPTVLDGFDEPETSEPLDEPEVSEPDPPEPLCGDGVCEVLETCSTCLADCPYCRPSPGELIVTEIMQNPQVVSDALGEWFEVLSLANEPRSLMGLTLVDAEADAHLIESPLVIEPGQRLVFASSEDLGVGAQSDYVWQGFYLGNASDLIRVEYQGVLIDEVHYDGGVMWPDPTGASMKLNSEALSASLNDLGENWCEGVIPYGAGDLGTPGDENLACGLKAPSVCGDGECEEDEGCASCAEDCGVCPCDAGQGFNCQSVCAPLATLGDASCDAGWDCVDFGFDGGDCLDPGCGATLIFSEYVEGSSNTKAVEIFNPSPTAVDLSDYALWKITNGGAWGGDSMTITELEGTLEPGEVFVFCHAKLAETLGEICDRTSGGNPMNFNGDDALGLAYGGTLVDTIGTEGEDPGAGWGLDGVTDATKDHTLVRLPEVTSGSLDWSSATLGWLVSDKDMTTGLGAHEVALMCVVEPAP